MKFPNRIREFRLSCGKSQEELASISGTTSQQMSRLERGERRLSQVWMKRIAPALGRQPYEPLPDAPLNRALQSVTAPEGHWIRHHPDIGRPILEKAEQIEKLDANTRELQRKAGEIEAEILEQARNHWARSEIVTARTMVAGEPS